MKKISIISAFSEWRIFSSFRMWFYLFVWGDKERRKIFAFRMQTNLSWSGWRISVLRLQNYSQIYSQLLLLFISLAFQFELLFENSLIFFSTYFHFTLNDVECKWENQQKCLDLMLCLCICITRYTWFHTFLSFFRKIANIFHVARSDLFDRHLNLLNTKHIQHTRFGCMWWRWERNKRKWNRLDGRMSSKEEETAVNNT